VGNCLFLSARGWGIDHQVRINLQIPGGYAGGGMVTGRIEPCITKEVRLLHDLRHENIVGFKAVCHYPVLEIPHLRDSWFKKFLVLKIPQILKIPDFKDSPFQRFSILKIPAFKNSPF